ncbi:hypothetical protein Pfo_007080 [Paulownia fortunei]|nr:hypothetical protein Pfo_007080 [Paulownia fortunei]
MNIEVLRNAVSDNELRLCRRRVGKRVDIVVLMRNNTHMSSHQSARLSFGGKMRADDHTDAHGQCIGLTDAPSLVVGKGKRLRESLDRFSPRHNFRDNIFTFGINELEGTHFYWDAKDATLGLFKIMIVVNEEDVTRFCQMPATTLEVLAASDRLTIILMATTSYQSAFSSHIEKCHTLAEKKNTSEIMHLEEKVEKMTKEYKILVERFDRKIATNELFLKTRVEEGFTAQTSIAGISIFKVFDEFDVAVMERVEAIYNQTIHICRRTLRDSSHVSKEIVMLLDTRVLDTEESAIMDDGASRIASNGAIETTRNGATGGVLEDVAT